MSIMDLDPDTPKIIIMLILDIITMIILMRQTIERKADLLENKAMLMTIEMSFLVFENTDDYVCMLNETNYLLCYKLRILELIKYF